MPKRVLEGKVVSNKNQKTVTVLVERRVRDPLYGKIIRRSAKYAAHVESGEWSVGDLVSIEECRPISKTKNWKVISGKSMGVSQAETIDETAAIRSSAKKKEKSEEKAEEVTKEEKE